MSFLCTHVVSSWNAVATVDKAPLAMEILHSLERSVLYVEHPL